VSHSGYRESEIVAAFSTEAQEPQKRAKGSDQLLRRRRPALAGPLQKKVSKSPRIPLADVLAKRPE
jgi:hypothetical protein